MSTEQKPLGSGFSERTLPQDLMVGPSVSGKTVIVTGGHSGIGLVTTKALLEAGAEVVVGARDLQKAKKALGGRKGLTLLPLDLANPRSVDEFCEEFHRDRDKLHLLINNAGIMALPTLERDSRGYEMQFATNHLGHFQLTSRLWGVLREAQGARVVSLSSYGHRFSGVHFEDLHFNHRPYDRWLAYGQSKTANSLFALELDRRGEDFGIRAFAVHPGRILDTDLGRFMTPEEREASLRRARSEAQDSVYLKSVEEGAATTLWAAISPQLEGKGGVYCADCDIAILVHEDSPLPNSVRDYAVDGVLAEKLWIASEKMTGLAEIRAK